MPRKIMTALLLVCVLATAGCAPWWRHDHDRGGREGGGEGFYRR